MSNSALVSYTKLSPNKISPRNHPIDRITPHCVVGQLSAESICGCFIDPTRKASCNYGIGTDGRVSLCVDEKDRSWCSSNAANDNRAITIECASDKIEPYAMNAKVYESLITLCVDICKRNGKNKLIWFGDKEKTLNYSPASDEMILTVHRWFANKSCPGDWLYARLGDLAKTVTESLGSFNTVTTTDTPKTSSDLLNMTYREAIDKVAPLFINDYKSSGILLSVSLAQFIVESAYGSSELATKANNYFGMKVNLSGNTWVGSVWSGEKYTKETKEFKNGKWINTVAEFRKYSSIEESIADHSAYLCNAMNENNKRYAGLSGCTSPETALQIIKNGGYATDPNYVSSLLGTINDWDLTKYDNATVDNADLTVPFMVKVSIDNLNIREKPSASSKSNGKTGKGVFTIVEVRRGWGKLKSGAGWISLNYTTRV